MIGPEIQKAVFDALMAFPAIADGRVYDRVPENPQFPYVAIGDEQTIDDGNACDDGWEVYPDIHVWSRAVGHVEAKQLMAAVVPRIKAIGAVPGFDVVSVSFEGTRIFTDADGLTIHGVVTPKFIVTPA
jgi:hypothetical protein